MRNISAMWPISGFITFVLAIHHASALEVRHNVAFTKVNQSPWQPGPGFSEEFHFDDLKTDFNVNLPRLNGSPIAQIADFLGIPLPLDASVGVRGSVSGFAGLDFGYYVHGGRFNLKYPARSSLNIATAPGSNIIPQRTPFTISSEFLPGVSGRTYPIPGLTTVAGNGYAQLSVDDFSFEHFQNPQFGTEFPYASAWATLGYDIQAEASVEARGCFIACFSASKPFTFGDGREVTLVEIDPSGVSIAGQPRVPLFDQNIPVAGFGNVRVSYPDVKVAANGVDANNRLHGFNSKPIISLQGQVEKLVPFIGPFLANSIGPIGYELLRTQGGPSLSLYQDFTFTPEPRVRLEFSTPMLVRGADGGFHAANEYEFALGDDIELKTMVGPVTDVVVRPTYFLRNTLRNQTGLSLGVNFDVDVLSLTTPFGPLGPAHHSDLDFDNLVKFPVFDESFEIPMAAVTGADIPLQTLFAFGISQLDVRILTADFIAQDPETGIATYNMQFLAQGIPPAPTETPPPPFEFNAIANGEVVVLPFGDTPYAQTLLVLAEDLIVGEGETALNLGSAFCIDCIDGRNFFEAVNPALPDDQGDLLYLARLFEFDDGLVDVDADPILSQNNFVNNHTEIPIVIMPTEVTPIPEPSSRWLMLLAAAAIMAVHGRGAPKLLHCLTAAFVVAGLSLVIAAPARATLITNGSFETVGFVPPASNIVDVPVGSTDITGWTVLNDSIAWGRTPNAFGLEPAPGNGVAVLDLSGFSDNAPHGGVLQTIATIPGQRYTLSMDLGTNQSNPSFSGPISVLASAAGGTHVLTHDPAGTGNQWQNYSLDFVATAANTPIRISGLNGNAYIGLDNVSVAESINPPLPTTIVYANDFEIGAGPEWSDTTISMAPGTAAHPPDRFLGRFSSGTEAGFSPSVELTLNNLAPHSEVTLTTDLYIIHSWDGNRVEFPYGPDRFTLSVVDGPTLLDTTFSNVTSPPFGIPFLQSYPDPYLTADNPQFFGSVEARSLGYVEFGFNIDAVYRLSYTFPHTDNDLVLRFLADTVVPLGGGDDAEAFGIDNITITINSVIPEPTGLMLSLAAATFIGVSSCSRRRHLV